jgi:hypothetical protein
MGRHAVLVGVIAIVTALPQVPTPHPARSE